MSVIDAALRFSQCRWVFTHDEILKVLTDRLTAKAMKGKDVAEFLGIAPARVTEMTKGERRIQPSEMAPLADFLGMTDGEKGSVKTAEVINIWDHISDVDRPTALRVLRAFTEGQASEQ